MEERSCKVRCPRCHLFYDCSDGMLPVPEGARAPEGRQEEPPPRHEEPWRGA